jgi:hypothetical protein
VAEQTIIQRRSVVAGLVGLGACSAAGPVQPPAPRSVMEMRFPLPDELKPDAEQTLVTAGPEFDRFVRIFSRMLDVTKMRDNRGARGVLASNVLIAYGYIDEHFFISKPVFDLCENDGQLAAIIAQRFRASMGFNLAEMAPAYKLPLNKSLVTEPWLNAMRQGDRYAINVLAVMGYDPRDVAVIWQRIGMSESGGQAGFSARLGYMASELQTLGYVT